MPRDRVERDWTQPYEASRGVMDVVRRIYEGIGTGSEEHWDAYEMCEKLVDVEERFQLWRYRHMMTVQRIIGFKQGTGGSSGVGTGRSPASRFAPCSSWGVSCCLSCFGSCSAMGARPLASGSVS